MHRKREWPRPVKGKKKEKSFPGMGGGKSSFSTYVIFIERKDYRAMAGKRVKKAKEIHRLQNEVEDGPKKWVHGKPSTKERGWRE